MILYFSATGNSKYVATRIGKALNENVVSIEKCSGKITISAEECLGIVTPTAWWELPVAMRDFLRGLTIEGRPSYTFVVVTYGTTPGACDADAAHELKKHGITVNAAFGITMPDTWTPIFDLTDKSKVSAINHEADREIAAMLPMLKAHQYGIHIRRRMPYPIRFFTNPLLELERHTKYFHLEEACIGCGLCERNCPAKAIELKNGHPVWVKDKCSLCLRCLHSCPKFAIQYGRHTKLHGQYLHPSIQEQ